MIEDAFLRLYAQRFNRSPSALSADFVNGAKAASRVFYQDAADLRLNWRLQATVFSSRDYTTVKFYEPLRSIIPQPFNNLPPELRPRRVTLKSFIYAALTKDYGPQEKGWPAPFREGVKEQISYLSNPKRILATRCEQILNDITNCPPPLKKLHRRATLIAARLAL